MRRTAQAAFTLIELLVVISIISVLATVVFVALDPAGRLADARDARRTTDVQSILTAIHECIVDNAGSLTTCGIGSLTSTEVYHITSAAVATGCNDNCSEEMEVDGSGGDTRCVNLSSTLANYLASLPVDPGGVATNQTEYTVAVNTTNGIVTIASCSDEGIQVTASR